MQPENPARYLAQQKSSFPISRISKSLEEKTVRRSRKHQNTERHSRLVRTYQSRRYTRPAILKTVFAGSWRMARTKLFSLEIPCSLEVRISPLSS